MGVYKIFNSTNLLIISRKKVEQVQTFRNNSTKYAFLTVVDLQKTKKKVFLRNRLHSLTPNEEVIEKLFPKQKPQKNVQPTKKKH